MAPLTPLLSFLTIHGRGLFSSLFFRVCSPNSDHPPTDETTTTLTLLTISLQASTGGHQEAASHGSPLLGRASVRTPLCRHAICGVPVCTLSPPCVRNSFNPQSVDTPLLLQIHFAPHHPCTPSVARLGSLHNDNSCLNIFYPVPRPRPKMAIAHPPGNPSFGFSRR